MLRNGDKTHFCGFVYALDIIFLYGHNCRITFARREYAFSGMMFRLELIHGEVKFAQ